MAVWSEEGVQVAVWCEGGVQVAVWCEGVYRWQCGVRGCTGGSVV